MDKKQKILLALTMLIALSLTLVIVPHIFLSRNSRITHRSLIVKNYRKMRRSPVTLTLSVIKVPDQTSKTLHTLKLIMAMKLQLPENLTEIIGSYSYTLSSIKDAIQSFGGSVIKVVDGCVIGEYVPSVSSQYYGFISYPVSREVFLQICTNGTIKAWTLSDNETEWVEIINWPKLYYTGQFYNLLYYAAIKLLKKIGVPETILERLSPNNATYYIPQLGDNAYLHIIAILGTYSSGTFKIVQLKLLSNNIKYVIIVLDNQQSDITENDASLRIDCAGSRYITKSLPYLYVIIPKIYTKFGTFYNQYCTIYINTGWFGNNESMLFVIIVT